MSQICSKEILAVTVHCQVSDCDQALTVTLLCSKNYTVTKNVTHWDQNCDYNSEAKKCEKIHTSQSEV